MGMRTRARGSNQYRDRPRSVPISAPCPAGLLDQAQTDTRPELTGKCWEFWGVFGAIPGTQCTVPVGPPSWSHGNHPDVTARRNAAMRYYTATGSSPQPEIMRLLAQDPDPEVRRLVARNSRTPPAILELLAHDPDPEIRRETAWSSNALPATVELLARDPDPQTREGAACHSGSLRTLRRLAHDHDPQVRSGTARNIITPPALLEQLARDPDPEVRCGTAMNDHTPPATLEQLLQDTEHKVSELASRHPNLPRAARAMWQLAH